MKKNNDPNYGGQQKGIVRQGRVLKHWMATEFLVFLQL